MLADAPNELNLTWWPAFALTLLVLSPSLVTPRYTTIARMAAAVTPRTARAQLFGQRCDFPMMIAICQLSASICSASGFGRCQ